MVTSSLAGPSRMLFRGAGRMVSGIDLFDCSSPTFTNLDPAITERAFVQGRLCDTSILKQVTVFSVKSESPTQEILTQIGKEELVPGDEMDLLAFHLLNPKHHQRRKIVALGCVWILEEGMYRPRRRDELAEAEVSPCIYTEADSGVFGGKNHNRIWTPRYDVVVKRR